MTHYLLCKRLVGPQGRSAWHKNEKTFASTGVRNPNSPVRVEIRCNTLPRPRMRSPLGLTYFLNTLHVPTFTLDGSCQTAQVSGLSIIVTSQEGSQGNIPSSLFRSAFRSGKTQISAHNVQQTVFPAVSLSVINTRRGIVCLVAAMQGKK